MCQYLTIYVRTFNYRRLDAFYKHIFCIVIQFLITFKLNETKPCTLVAYSEGK